MGRAPCCDKANVKKGPWSPEEDDKLKAYIQNHGTGGNWIALPQKIGLKRCGKSCRLRWLNYLRPNLKHGGFSEEEDEIICTLYLNIGSRWSIIAAQLPGRTDNDIKNYWNTKLKKKLLGKQRKEQQARRASHLKLNMKRANENFAAPNATNILYPYWPNLPVANSIPNPNHEPHFNDQTSIKNFMVKLGGRFYIDHLQQYNAITNFHYPFDISPTKNQLHDNFTNIDNGAGLNNFQDFNDYPIEIDERIYGNMQQLDGLEVNGSSGAESTSWGDMSSIVCPNYMVTNYEDGRQGILLENFRFEESGYPGLQ